MAYRESGLADGGAKPVWHRKTWSVDPREHESDLVAAAKGVFSDPSNVTSAGTALQDVSLPPF